MEGVACIGHHELRIAAVAVIAGELTLFAEVFRSPLQLTQWPQLPASHATPTRSPGVNSATCPPQRTTTPTTSWPGISGNLCGASAPSAMCTSVRQTPQAATRTRIWCGAGCGTGKRTACSGCPGAASTIAIMLSGAATWSMSCPQAHASYGNPIRAQAAHSSARAPLGRVLFRNAETSAIRLAPVSSSGRRVSNSQPRSWQGCARPAGVAP